MACQWAADSDMLSAKQPADQMVCQKVSRQAAETASSKALHSVCRSVETLGCAMGRRLASRKVAQMVQGTARTTVACSAVLSEADSGALWERRAAEWLGSLSEYATEPWMALMKVASTVAWMDGDWVDDWVAPMDGIPLAAH